MPEAARAGAAASEGSRSGRYESVGARGGGYGSVGSRAGEPGSVSARAREFLRSAEVGTRVVVRRREDDGFHDALGYLEHTDERGYQMRTRSGLVTLPWESVTRAKAVPEPPARRGSQSGSGLSATGPTGGAHHGAEPTP